MLDVSHPVVDISKSVHTLYYVKNEYLNIDTNS